MAKKKENLYVWHRQKCSKMSLSFSYPMLSHVCRLSLSLWLVLPQKLASCDEMKLSYLAITIKKVSYSVIRKLLPLTYKYTIWSEFLLVFSTSVQSTIRVALPLGIISYCYDQLALFTAGLGDYIFDCCQVHWSLLLFPLIISVPQVLFKVLVTWKNRKYKKR